MNIVKARPANTIIGSNHGHRISSNPNHTFWGNNSSVHGTGVSMNYVDTLIMLLRWKREGWDVHPIIDKDFAGWV